MRCRTCGWAPTGRRCNAVSVRLSQGLPILGAETDGTAPDAARQNEQSNFFKINFQAHPDADAVLAVRQAAASR